MAIHPERREVVVGSADDLAGHRVTLEEVNWLAPPLEMGDGARCRCGTAPVACRPPSSRSRPTGSTLALEIPVRAITPGQSGVVYDGEGRVLGGGVIA